MKQITVKNVAQALHWIQHNEHHCVGTEYHSVTGKPTHIFYQNYHEKMRVPLHLSPEVGKYTRPNKRAFDTRMFAVTRAGRLLATSCA